MSLIYKLVDKNLWRLATESGEFAGAEIDRKDGFIRHSLCHPSFAVQQVSSGTVCATHLLPSSRFRQANILSEAKPPTKPLEQISFADIRDQDSTQFVPPIFCRPADSAQFVPPIFCRPADSGKPTYCLIRHNLCHPSFAVQQIQASQHIV
ncbi:MAG TPA: hypothetical protein DDZ51_22390 [Planctomycetaceae bacterium]|nr:hypothetical protein [Planctomycetaceae bacterium]